MAYRPSHAGFDLNAGSAMAGVLPASFQAAVIGSGLMAAWLLAESFIRDGLPDLAIIIAAILGLGLLAFFTIIIATVFCAVYIALIGVPLASLMGRRLATPLGLVVACLAALSAGTIASAAFGVWPLFDTPDWRFALLVFAYALPAGLLYRRAVINARMLSPFAEPAA
jgi:hypothetical protein